MLYGITFAWIFEFSSRISIFSFVIFTLGQTAAFYSFFPLYKNLNFFVQHDNRGLFPKQIVINKATKKNYKTDYQSTRETFLKMTKSIKIYICWRRKKISDAPRENRQYMRNYYCKAKTLFDDLINFDEE